MAWRHRIIGLLFPPCTSSTSLHLLALEGNWKPLLQAQQGAEIIFVLQALNNPRGNHKEETFKVDLARLFNWPYAPNFRCPFPTSIHVGGGAGLASHVCTQSLLIPPFEK